MTQVSLFRRHGVFETLFLRSGPRLSSMFNSERYHLVKHSSRYSVVSVQYWWTLPRSRWIWSLGPCHKRLSRMGAGQPRQNRMRRAKSWLEEVHSSSYVAKRTFRFCPTP